MRQKKFALQLIKLLDHLFESDLVQEFCLFGWENKKELLKRSAIISFYFKISILNNDKLLVINSGHNVFSKTIQFQQPIFNKKNSHSLIIEIEKNIPQKISVNNKDKKHYASNYGIIFYRNNWKELVKQIFSNEIYQEYFCLKFKNHLNNKLPYSNFNGKILKI